MSFLGDVLGPIFGPDFGGYFMKRRARKMWLTRRIECSIRRVGDAGGFAGYWSHGVATVAPGVLHFEPRVGMPGNRNFYVTEVERLSRRDEMRVQGWNELNAWAMVWRLRTPAGAFDWAVNRAVIDDVAAYLTTSTETE